MIKITVCILNWKQYDILAQSLPKIRNELRNIAHEIIVYDQESDPIQSAFLRDSKLVDTCLFSETNTGNSVSRNTMLQQSTGRYILLLDSDIIPIPNSITSLYNFLETHPEYVGVGYDPYCPSTTNFNECTALESEIDINDTMRENEFILSQYGLFKRETLIDFPFPEFGPFNKAGWGAEDAISGLALFANGHLVARVLGRTYWHDTHSSTKILADQYLPSRAQRRTYWHYFSKLSPTDMKRSLQHQSITKTHLDLHQYSIYNTTNKEFKQSNNLGDKLFPWLLREFFPFFQFSNNSCNTLFFGGCVFRHIKNLNKKQQSVIFYGCGLSKESELSELHTYKNLTIYPRGFISESILNTNNIETQPPIGDPALCLTMLPQIQHNTRGKDIFVADALNKEYQFDAQLNRICVAGTELTTDLHTISDINDFFDLLQQVSTLCSSQVHPYLISLFLGIPATLTKKDLRAEDFIGFFDIPNTVPHEMIQSIREKIQVNHLEKFIYCLIDTLMPYSKGGHNP